jgi:hypothetical protein
MDVKRLARFCRPSHRITGDRYDRIPNRGVGYDYLHVVVDDNSRLAYVELHPARTRRRTPARPSARWPGSQGSASPRQGP